MAIQLKGYETVVENQVYNSQPFLDDQNRQVRPYLLLTRYREPTETEVLEYLQSAARGVSSIQLPPGTTLRGMSKIARYMGESLPKNLINDLKAGDLNCLRFVRRFIPAKDMPIEEAISWLVARYGLLPDELVQKYQPTDMDWYGKAFSHDQLQEDGLGQNFQLKLRLPLIDRAEADILIKHGVMTSDALDTDRRYKLAETTSLLDALYSAVSFDAVNDVSEEIKDLHAGKTVGTIKEQAVRQAMAQRAMTDAAKDPHKLQQKIEALLAKKP